MAKHRLLIAALIILISFSVSCEKSAEMKSSADCETETLHEPQITDFISQSPLAVKYYPVWKSRFMQRNKLSEEFFNKHITVHYVDTSYISYNLATALVISYTYHSEWAVTGSGEQMTIRINDSASPLFSSNIPLNTDLTSEQIDNLGSNNPATLPHFYYPVSKDTKLKFNDLNSAKDALRTYLKLDKLCNFGIGINETGQLELRYYDSDMSDTSEGGGYYCRNVNLNLITGNIKLNEGICIP